MDRGRIENLIVERETVSWDLQKLQKNPIFRILVDIRQNINFVRAFTTSANVPSIYIQLFWNTLTHECKNTESTIYNKYSNSLEVSHEYGQAPVNRWLCVNSAPRPPENTQNNVPWIIASQYETTGPSVHPEDATSAKMVRETLSHADAESGVTPKEHVHAGKSTDSSKTLSSMKNLEDS
ncbi:hypothetical protein Tco_1294464 [Tanacetum coccineum]